MAEALALLGGEGIDLVLLKGAALRAERQEVVGRFQCDVDVLVRRQDLQRAESLLRQAGFRLDESYLDRESLLKRHFHLAYERRGAVIELHWDIDFATQDGFLDRLWGRSRVIERNGLSLRIPSPEHNLLFGCLHLCRHSFFGGLRWLADLTMLLPEDAEVRARFAEEAAAWPRRAVFCPLWLLDFYGVPEAGVLGAGLQPGWTESLVLGRLLPALLLAEPWMGIPAWRAAKAVEGWLFSKRPLLPLLAGFWGDGVRRRLSARIGRLQPEG